MLGVVHILYKKKWAQWLAMLQEGSGFKPADHLEPFCAQFAWCPCVCGFSYTYSSFLPQPKDL